RRSTHDEPTPAGLDTQGQVRAAARNHIDGKRLLLDTQVLAQPGAEAIAVEVLAHRRGSLPHDLALRQPRCGLASPSRLTGTGAGTTMFLTAPLRPRRNNRGESKGQWRS